MIRATSLLVQKGKAVSLNTEIDIAHKKMFIIVQLVMIVLNLSDTSKR